MSQTEASGSNYWKGKGAATACDQQLFEGRVKT